MCLCVSVQTAAITAYFTSAVPLELKSDSSLHAAHANSVKTSTPMHPVGDGLTELEWCSEIHVDFHSQMQLPSPKPSRS